MNELDDPAPPIYDKTTEARKMIERFSILSLNLDDVGLLGSIEEAMDDTIKDAGLNLFDDHDVSIDHGSPISKQPEDVLNESKNSQEVVLLFDQASSESNVLEEGVPESNQDDVLSPAESTPLLQQIDNDELNDTRLSIDGVDAMIDELVEEINMSYMNDSLGESSITDKPLQSNTDLASQKPSFHNEIAVHAVSSTASDDVVQKVDGILETPPIQPTLISPEAIEMAKPDAYDEALNITEQKGDPQTNQDSLSANSNEKDRDEGLSI